MPDQSTYPTLTRECCLQRPDPVWLALALVVATQSLVLGHLRERYASGWPAMLGHDISCCRSSGAVQDSHNQRMGVALIAALVLEARIVAVERERVGK